MHSWVQRPDCERAAQQEPAAAPQSRRASADPARAPPYCSHPGETQHGKWRREEKLLLLNNVSCRVILKNKASKRACFISAHLNSTALKEFISVVLAPHRMYPIATSVLESSWLGLCLVEFNTVVNSAESWDKKNKNYDINNLIITVVQCGIMQSDFNEDIV